MSINNNTNKEKPHNKYIENNLLQPKGFNLLYKISNLILRTLGNID